MQEDEFVKNLTAVLKNSYSRALFAFAKAKVSFLPEIRYPDHVEVPVVIRPPNDKFPLIFRMRKEAQAWRIYDVVIQEVSLVDTNQRQFARIIRSSLIITCSRFSRPRVSKIIFTEEETAN